MSLLTITVRSHELVLAYRDGVFVRVLEPGRHLSRPRTSYVRLDRRDQVGQTAVQEILTSDGVSLRVTAAYVWSVADAVAFHERSVDPTAVVYLAVQVALREALATLTVDEVLTTGRRAVVESVTSAAAAAGADVGVGVREVVLKDVILPGELRAAYAEEVTARQRGKAQLEAARAETAALRSLANGAKLLAENPALAQLRLVQALPYGAQLKVTLPSAAESGS
ncbi:MAG TPA: slipin family protein [Nocardioidaceae bacterium]|nr:slipin family protein [Nocardioidaceae bacterium]